VFSIGTTLYTHYNDSKTIESLQQQLILEKDLRANDSSLLSEYQNALEQYMKSSPQEAEKFMRLIENLNE
jgi:phage terminase small subunit